MRALALAGALAGCAVLAVGGPTALEAAAVAVVITVFGLLAIGLVPAAPAWLRAVVGVGATLLAACLWLALEAEVGAGTVRPIIGVIGCLGFVLALALDLRRRRAVSASPERREPSRDHGVAIPAQRRPGQIGTARSAAVRGAGGRGGQRRLTRDPARGAHRTTRTVRRARRGTRAR